MTRPTHRWGLFIAVALLEFAVSALAAPSVAAPTGSGYTAAALYNAANSYARAGKAGMAILYYERARLLAPNDSDIEANLRYVRASSRLPRRSRAGPHGSAPWAVRPCFRGSG